jgi:hypothetical protein
LAGATLRSLDSAAPKHIVMPPMRFCPMVAGY